MRWKNQNASKYSLHSKRATELLAPDGAAARLGLKQSTLRPDMQKVGTSSAPRSGPVQQVPKQGSPMPFFR